MPNPNPTPPPRRRLPTPQIETFNTGHARSWLWRIMPSPVLTLFSLLLAGSITGLAMYAGDRLGDGKGYQWSLIAMAVMTLGVFGYAWWARRRLNGAQSAPPAGSRQAGQEYPGGWEAPAHDPVEAAQLDELRENFEHGLEIFRQHGKDLYELPWYVMVGEPGTGKTEAIRKSELRFPPGLHEKLQGAGATASMNWWFTNNAVLLDTGGALLVESEAAARFAEFLRLLREHRTDYPLNGLILTLSVEKLLVDPPHVAEEKARLIANQLKAIQTSLDVRFPLYLLVTQSDRLPGFGEFFDAEGQGAFEQQMFGWSNPDPVGAPFEAGRLEEAMEAITARLHRRALALLADPVPRIEGRRRTDEVDALYTLPETLRALTRRVRGYLETIFPPGTWKGQAPFFRGLYFTSALREGTQLDELLAHALNVDVQKLPAGRLFTRDNPAFLRDVFLAKIFPERGLVTRLRDVAADQRRRLLLYYGAALVILLVCLGLTLLVRQSLTEQLATEQKAWLQANASWNNGALLPPIVRRAGPQGQPPTWSWSELGQPLTQVEGIVDFTRRRLRWAPVFKPLGEWRSFERRRREAGQALFEASILKPLLTAARERIRWDTTKHAQRRRETDERLARAYQQLASLEAWAGTSEKGGGVTIEQARWQEFHGDLLAYVLAQPREQVERQAQRMAVLTVKVYGTQAPLAERDWLAEQEHEAEYSALHHAATLLFGPTASQAVAGDERRAELARQRRALLESFQATEKLVAERSRGGDPATRQQVEQEYMGPLREAVKNYDTSVAEERGGSATASIDFRALRGAAQTTLEVLRILGGGTECILRNFQPQAAQLVAIEGAGGSAEDGTAWNNARGRLENYEKHFAPMQAPMPVGDMIGQLKPRLQAVLDMTSRATTGGAPPPASETDEAATMRFLEKFRGTPAVSGALQSYQRQLMAELKEKLKFPLVNTKEAFANRFQFEQDCTRLAKIQKDAVDLDSMLELSLGVPERETLRNEFAKLQPVFQIMRTLGGVPGVPADEGLILRVDAAPAPQAQTPPVAEAVRPGGFFTPRSNPPPPIYVAPTSGSIKSITITVNGRQQQGNIGGKYSDQPFDGFADVRIVVIRTISGAADDVCEVAWAKGWHLLRQAVEARNSRFSIPRTGLGFSLEARPSLPFNQWPKRGDFGLESVK